MSHTEASTRSGRVLQALGYAQLLAATVLPFVPGWYASVLRHMIGSCVLVLLTPGVPVYELIAILLFSFLHLRTSFFTVMVISSSVGYRIVR
jgi:hypothetical protein